MTEAVLEVGVEVRVVDGIVQDYTEEFAVFRHIEQDNLNRYSGKVGSVCYVDGYEEMPYLVAFQPEARVPFGTFRFRAEEIDAL